jgi:hypothetical protein
MTNLETQTLQAVRLAVTAWSAYKHHPRADEYVRGAANQAGAFIQRIASTYTAEEWLDIAAKSRSGSPEDADTCGQLAVAAKGGYGFLGRE